LIQQIDAMGGSVAAIESGWMQQKISDSAYKYQKDIESKDKIIVGVNEFISDENNKIPVFKIDARIQQAQIENIKALKANRDNVLAVNCLAAISAAVNAGQNIMPPVIAAVEANCTLGEISDVLRNIFGEYQA
jgi:methylmalonyl-CoA mutase N-terminal domain/subunit